jgi:multidrug resistance efflux pump
LASAKANAVLAHAMLDRGRSLIQSGSVSKQDRDQRTADIDNKQGLLKSAQANLDRPRVLEKYKRIDGAIARHHSCPGHGYRRTLPSRHIIRHD